MHVVVQSLIVVNVVVVVIVGCRNNSSSTSSIIVIIINDVVVRKQLYVMVSDMYCIIQHLRSHCDVLAMKILILNYKKKNKGMEILCIKE